MVASAARRRIGLAPYAHARLRRKPVIANRQRMRACARVAGDILYLAIGPCKALQCPGQIKVKARAALGGTKGHPSQGAARRGYFNRLAHRVRHHPATVGSGDIDAVGHWCTEIHLGVDALLGHRMHHLDNAVGGEVALEPTAARLRDMGMAEKAVGPAEHP
mgnify:CR=1 FL=1